MKMCAQPTCSVLDILPQPPKPPKPPKPSQSPILPPPNLKLTSQNWLATAGTSRIQCYPSHRFPKHLPNAKAHVPWQAGTHQHIAAFGNLPWEPLCRLCPTSTQRLRSFIQWVPSLGLPAHEVSRVFKGCLI